MVDVENLKTVKGYVCAASVVCCLVGLIVQWSQTKDDWCSKGSTCTQQRVNEYGTYALFMVIVSIANLYSLAAAKPELLWVSAAVMLQIVDTNICVANFIRVNSKSDALLASYAISLIGTLGSFVAVPVRISAFGLKQMLACAFGGIVVLGSILIWARGAPCFDIQLGQQRTTTPKYPVYVSRGVFLALWYTVSSLSNYVPGLELSFMYAVIQIANYQPFGPRCDKDTCKAGTSLVFISLICMSAYHLITDCAGQGVPFAEAIANLKTNRKAWFVSACAVAALVGAIFIFAKTDDWQEVWDVFSMVVVAFMMIFVEVTKHPGAAVFCMCLLYSVIGRCVAGYSQGKGTEGITQDTGSLVRMGWILIFLGTLSSFLALPVEWGQGNLMSKLQGEAKAYTISAITIMCMVIYLWSEEAYEGQLGVISLLLGVVTAYGFPQGLQWVYFVAILEIPGLTPFTATEAQTSDLYGGGGKIAILIAWVALLTVVFLHLNKFGATAFNDVRLFKQGDAHEEYGEIAPSTTATTNYGTASLSAPPPEPQGYATQKPVEEEA